MTTTLAPFDPTDPDTLADPYPRYARHREREPVQCAPSPSPLFPEQWFLFRHADVAAALREPRLGRDWRNAVDAPPPPATVPEPLRALAELVGSWMLFVDPPLHTELRGSVAAAFRPALLAPLERDIDARADALLASLTGRERFDAIADFALPLTSGAIATVLGVPAREEARFLDAFRRLEPVFGGARESLSGAAAAARELVELFDAALERAESGILRGFRTAHGEARRRAIASCIFLFGAGFATTIHAVANGVLALSARADPWERLRSEPALLAGTAEEILRFDPPIQRVQRFAREPLELAGRRFARGALIVPVIGSANRDPEVFASPDVFDPARDARAQLAFGGGIHFCLGAWLARLELRCALAALLRALPRLERATDVPLEWRERAARGLRALPILGAR